VPPPNSGSFPPNTPRDGGASASICSAGASSARKGGEDVEALGARRRPKQRSACEEIFGEPDSEPEEDTASASEQSEPPPPKRQRNDDGIEKVEARVLANHEPPTPYVVYEGFRSFGRANPTHLSIEEPLA